MPVIKKIKLGDFAKILLKYASSQVSGNLLRMVAGLLTVRLISPDIYGYFNGKGIFLGYLSLAHIGILNGLNRDLPVEHGRKNYDKVKELAALGLWISLVIGAVASIVLIVMGCNAFYHHQTNDAILYFTYSTSAFFLLLSKFYLPTLFKTNMDFVKLTHITIYFSIFNVFTVIMVWVFPNLIGLCLRLIMLNIFEFSLLFFMQPTKVAPKWSLKSTKQLLHTGVPIYIVGYIGSLWDTIKNNIIFSLGGSLQYGYYALSGIVTSAVGTIPIAFSQVIYPKMSIAYGEGANPKDVIKLSYKPMLLLLFINSLIAILCLFFLPPIVHHFLPKYTPGINAALWILFLPIISSFSIISNYFNVYRKQKLYLVGIISGVIASAAYLYIFFHTFSIAFNLVIFSQSLLIGALIQNIICWILILNDVKGHTINK